MNAEHVAQALGRAARAGEEWKCLCPAHEDKNPSLTLRDADSGRLLYRCHAGCTQDEVGGALRARGFLPEPAAKVAGGRGAASVAVPSAHRHSPHYIAKFGEPVAVYDYRDAEARLVFQVARYQGEHGKKEIRPWRPNGAGLEARAALPPRPLYRLPELLAQSTLPVLVVEGEKCADAAAPILGKHYAVTTWAGGAKALRYTDTAPLDGRRVVLWPDADAAGREVMAELAHKCKARLTSVVEVGERPDGWDIADAVAEGWNEDVLLAFIEEHSAVVKSAEPATEQPSAAVYRLMADVAARPVRWLWPGKIARAKLTLVAGNPGLGKSQIVANLAAIVSTGGRWPLTDARASAGFVILLNAEDAADDTIRPRLDAAGADLSRVVEFQAVRDGFAVSGQPLERSFRLDRDLPVLRELAARHHPVDLIAIDPITAYLGEVDAYSNAEVRAALAPLALLAEESGAAVVLVSHLNKNQATPEALLRVSSSIAFTAAVRAAYVVARDNDNPKRRRLFLPLKNNLAEDVSGLAYLIESASAASPAGAIPTSRVAWEPEPVTISADEAVRPPVPDEERGAVDDAKEFLKGLLAGGPVSVRQVRADASGAGHSWRTIERAKKALVIDAYKDGMGGGWRWRLPSL